MNKFKLALGAAVAVASLGFMTGCAQGEADGVADNGNGTIYFIPIVDTGAYWNPMRAGAEATADRLGWNLVVQTTPPTEPQKNERHIGFVNSAVANNAAGIAVAPIEANMFRNPIRDAMDAGIPVITFDADLNDSEDRTAYVGTDNVLAGEVLGRNGAQEMLEQGITEGAIAIVTVDRTQPTMIAREEGIRRGFAEVMGEYADNFRFLETIQDDDQAAISMEQLSGQILANDDLVTVFSLGSEGPNIGVMEALSTQGRAGEILHFGFDWTPTWEQGIADGRITGIVAQDPWNIGVQVIEQLVRAIEGEEIPDNLPIDAVFVRAQDIMAHGELIEEQQTVTTE